MLGTAIIGGGLCGLALAMVARCAMFRAMDPARPG